MVTKPFLKRYFPVIGFPIAMFNCLSCKVMSPVTTIQSIQIKSLSTALKALKVFVAYQFTAQTRQRPG